MVKIISWLVVVVWVALIFNFSMQPAEQSAGLSRQVTEFLVKTVALVLPLPTDAKAMAKMVAHFHNVVRKFAHGGLYFVLGVLVINGFRKTGTKGLQAYVYALLFCIVYSATDEGHQTFVLGRSGQVSDIFIDTVGAIVGMGAYRIQQYFTRK